MRSEGAPPANPLRFEADDLALYLADGKAVTSATDALALPLARALELGARLEHRYQVQRDELARARPLRRK